jgi:rpsU-divergently transcribed protein
MLKIKYFQQTHKLHKFSRFYKKTLKSFCDFELKEKLVKMSLSNVDKYGWTENSIKLAANELGYSNGLSSLLENGPIDLVYSTMDNWNKKLQNEIENIKNETNLSVEEKYKKAIRFRLSLEIPVINTWPQAIRLGMDKENIKTTLEKLIEMTETICTLENEPSLARKYLIVKIFIFTEFHLLTDKSNNFTSTWDLLDKLYSINFGIYDTASKFININSSILKFLKYSLTSLLPYDFSQVEDILRKQQEIEEKESHFKI